MCGREVGADQRLQHLVAAEGLHADVMGVWHHITQSWEVRPPVVPAPGAKSGSCFARRSWVLHASEANLPPARWRRLGCSTLMSIAGLRTAAVTMTNRRGDKHGSGHVGLPVTQLRDLGRRQPVVLVGCVHLQPHTAINLSHSD